MSDTIYKANASSTRLILVRHGQSVGNLTRRFIGHGYAPLTELGHRQAEASAVFLDRYKIDAIYSSDLMRAYQTAEHTAKRQGCEIKTDPQLREIFAGEWESMSYDEIAEKYPALYQTWMTDTGNARLPGGESVGELRERARAALEGIALKNTGKTVAIFTHATPIRALRSVWQGDELDKIKEYGWVSNASITEVIYQKDAPPTVVMFGYDTHLTDIITRPSGI